MKVGTSLAGHMSRVFQMLFGSVLVACFFSETTAQQDRDYPVVRDERLELRLFAEQPDIVTPIGMAIDRQDRVFVLESHTHLPPRDYEGPEKDRVKVFRDLDGDGIADKVTVFADQLNEGMNLAFSPEGILYVVCAREVWALYDSDGDGVSDSRKRVAHVETSNHYPHSCLLGITFSNDGWLYFSRGNNGSTKYVVYGSDGSQVSGYGDGGNIVRCRPDGSGLEEFATGFWNAFDIQFDPYGRLLCVDNDPDACGPNRIVHVVQHGDYGYRSIYGGGGNHPFQAWEGELPGTLPYVAGTGEAPSGLMIASRASLPVDYQNDLLVTIWNENSIERYRTEPKGVSLIGTHEVLISGSKNFRPVALDADSKGNIFFTDWVLVDYPNHGKGRIWRMSVKEGNVRTEPRDDYEEYKKNEAYGEFLELLPLDSPKGIPKMLEGLYSADPFMTHAAVVALSNDAFRTEAVKWTKHKDGNVRLGALLALKRAGYQRGTTIVRELLEDPLPVIRQAALIWAGSSGMTELREELNRSISSKEVSSVLFETYLAAMESLDPEFVDAKRNEAKDKANQLKRSLPEDLLKQIVLNADQSDEVRTLALARMKPEKANSMVPYLMNLIRQEEGGLALEAVRALAVLEHRNLTAFLLDVALNIDAGDALRAEALLSLSYRPLNDASPLLTLLDDSSKTVRLEAARTLRQHLNQREIKEEVESRYREAKAEGKRNALVEQYEYGLFPPGTETAERWMRRPESAQEWMMVAGEAGDPERGRRVFYSLQTGCAHCHSMDNRGGQLGPSLSNLGQSVNRKGIIRSLLNPSEKFAPQYQAWIVETTDGEIHQGLQLDHKAGGAMELYTTGGETVYFSAEQIADYRASERSLMPDGLETTMTVHEFRDLIAFLTGLPNSLE